MRNCLLVVLGLALTNFLPSATQAQTAKEITLYSFTGGSDGYLPQSGVVFDSAGNLYGTNFFGGTINGYCPIGCGTVFELTPKKSGGWTHSTLHSFTGGTSDLGHSYAHVTFDTDGDLYGTAGFGGTNECLGGDCGGIFKLSPTNSWKETVVYTFNANTGETPSAGLVLNNGSLYSSTQFGPNRGEEAGFGTLFELSPQGSSGWTYNMIHAFHFGLDGYEPQTDLVFDSDGKVYGSTPYGGPYQSGDIFEMEQDSAGKWREKRIYTFPNFAIAVSYYPSTLILDSEGNLYGATGAGGQGCAPYGCGTVFELEKTASGWKENTLYEFQGGNDGEAPSAGLVFDAAGNLWGTTSYGGTGTCTSYEDSGCGTVFKLTLSHGAWTKSTIYNFTGGSDGENPSKGSLIFDASGNLYGTTSGGITTDGSGYGTVYEIQP